MKAEKEKAKTITDYFESLQLSEIQKVFLNKYSKVRTATRFEQEAAKTIGQPELVKDWYYAGYVDTGYFGGGKCSMGHTLRYEHHATNRITEEKVIFGIKCVRDFFHLTPQQLKLIQEGVMEVNKEVLSVLAKLEKAGSFKNYLHTSSIKNKLDVLIQRPEHEAEINDFLLMELPLLDKLEKEINTIYNRESSQRDFSQFLSENPVYLDLVVKAQNIEEDQQFKDKHLMVWEKVVNITGFLKKNRRLSQSQVASLTKLLETDYELVDNILDDLRLLPRNKFVKYGNFDEIEMIASIKAACDNWGLTPNQLEALKKSHKRHIKAITDIKNQMLQECC